MLGGVVRGKTITLRTTAEADLADHIRWHGEWEATKWLPRRPWPESLEQRREWLKQTSKDRALMHWEVEADGTHLGYADVRLIWPPRVEGWAVEALFLAPEARGRGLGADAAGALHRYLVDYVGLDFGDVRLYRDDAAGRRLFESLGYAEYAHGRDALYRGGRYWADWRGMLRAEEFRRRFPDELEYPSGPPGAAPRAGV